MYKIYFRGALTSKPYAFLARPWEFKSVDSIDVFEPLGSNIRVDLRGEKILRILPRSNDSINEDWISDKIRFICDAVRLQRIDTPILKLKNNFYSLTWTQVFDLLTYLHTNRFFYYSKFLSFNKKSNKLALGSGLFVDLDSSSLISRLTKNFFFKELSEDSLLQNYSVFDRGSFLLNNSLGQLSSYSSIILVGLNIKLLSPVLSIRLRTLAKSGIKIYNFGQKSLQVGFFDIGTLTDFYKLINAKHWLAGRLVKEKAFFLFDESFSIKNNLIKNFLSKSNFDFGVFGPNVSFLNLREYSYITNCLSKTNLSLAHVHTNVSASTVSDIELSGKKNLTGGSITISFLSHGGPVAELSDLLIPISSPFEQSKYYLNSLGNKQKTRLALTSPQGVLDHSEILNFFYLSLFEKSLLNSKELNFKFFLFFFTVASFYSKSIKDCWVFINYFFDLMESESFIFSRLINFIFYDLDFLRKDISNSYLFESQDKNIFLTPVKKSNYSLNESGLFNSDFYQNDEISLSSSTLSSASRRLLVKSSFV